MYGQDPHSVAPVELLYVIQKPRWSKGMSEPHLTAGYEPWQEHPVVDLLSGRNQGGQTSRWAVACSVKLNRKMSKKDCVALMLL